MLRDLRIQNVAIIEDVSVRFGQGLNVLSGETGAGKSIILGALGLILGARASVEMVRTGHSTAEVVGCFDLDPEVLAVLAKNDLPVPDKSEGLLIRRLITVGGRSRAYVNGTAVSTSVLRSLATVLVDYASQHEHRVLLDEARHRGVVDRFGDHDDLLTQVGERVRELRELDEERTRLRNHEADQRARLDFLQFQLAELKAFEPRVGEDEELEQERVVLADAVRLSELARGAESALYGGQAAAVERLGDAKSKLEKLVTTDESLAPLSTAISEALYVVEDVARDLAVYASRTQQNPARLQEIEDRLATLRQLTRKHRTDLPGLIALKRKLAAEVQELGSLDVRLDELDAAIVASRQEAAQVCTRLSARRREAGLELSRRVELELHSLAMPKAQLQVGLTPIGVGDGVALGEDGPWATSHGSDSISLLLSANPGEEPRPLARVASGGELSRILLALRRALAGTRSVRVQVCVFDEIDSGLGGATAESVAEKLVRIAEDGQVLVITHLPHIAAAGKTHFRVEKRVEEGRTHTGVRLLEGDARVQELVRMVAGSGATAAAESFARELLAHPGRL